MLVRWGRSNYSALPSSPHAALRPLLPGSRCSQTPIVRAQPTLKRRRCCLLLCLPCCCLAQLGVCAAAAAVVACAYGCPPTLPPNHSIGHTTLLRLPWPPQLYTTNTKEYNRRVRRIAQKSVDF